MQLFDVDFAERQNIIPMILSHAENSQSDLETGGRGGPKSKLSNIFALDLALARARLFPAENTANPCVPTCPTCPVRVFN